MSHRSSIALALALLAAESVAQELVIDLNETVSLASSEPTTFVEHLGGVCFDARHTTYGREIFLTDGTEDGTALLTDLFTYVWSITDLVSCGDRLLFKAANDLWSVADHPSTMVSLDAARYAEDLTRLGDRIVFTARVPGQAVHQIWVSDGTELGTHPVASSPIVDEDESRELFAYDGYVYFGTGDTAALWRTDGATCELVFDLESEEPLHFAEVDGWLWFGGQIRAFRTDGSILDELELAGFDEPTGFVAAGGACVFTARNAVTDKWRLWQSDGTQAGTVLTPAGWIDTFDPLRFAPLGAGVVVGTRTGSTGVLLWYDPALMSQQLLDSGEPVYELVANGNEAFAIRGDLWRTDGTPSGTSVVSGLDVSWYPGLSVAGGELWFRARDPSTSFGWEPYRIAGPGQPAELFADVAVPATHSSTFEACVRTTDGQVFCRASNGLVVRTDGTAAGTDIVGDAHWDLVTSGERVVFVEDHRLWMVAGPGASAIDIGPQEPGEIAPLSTVSQATRRWTKFLLAIDDHQYFVFRPEGESWGIYRADGTSSDPNAIIEDPDLYSLHGGFGTHLYYITRPGGGDIWNLRHVDVDSGFDELLFEDIAFGAAYLASEQLFVSDVASLGEHSAVVCVLDKTYRLDHGASGTTTTVLADHDGNFNGVGVASPIRLGEGVVFSIAGSQFNTPWFTDGTVQGTYEVSNLMGVNSPYCVVDGVAYFLGRGSGEFGLWRTDATAAGTHRVGPAFSDFPFHAEWSEEPVGHAAHTFFEERAPRAIGSGGTILFRGNHWATGNELWISDGTDAGTERFGDLWPAYGSSDPSEMVRAGGRVVMMAGNPAHGRELHFVEFDVLDGHVANTYGTGCAGAGAEPAISTTGAPIAGQPYDVRVEGAVPGEVALLFYSAGAAHIELDAGCTVYLAPNWILHSVSVIDAAGTGGPTMNFPASPVLFGLPLRFQFAVTDPAPTEYGGNLSDALEVIVGN